MSGRTRVSTSHHRRPASVALASVVLALACGAAPAVALHVEDRAFLLYALEVDLTQVRVGELVAEKAQDEQVRGFAQRMVDYHRQSSDRLAAIARRHGIEPPRALDPVSQKWRGRLQQLAGPPLDQGYLAGQAIYLYAARYAYRREALHGLSEPLQREADRQAEDMEQHRLLAQQIARGLPSPKPDPVALHAEDRTFLLYAMSVDQAQLRLGELAMEKARDERVRGFARRMVDYHRASFDRLAQVARENGLEPLQEVNPAVQQTRKRLQGLTGTLFDGEYVTTEVIQHYTAFYRYEREAIHGRREPLRDLAARAFRDVKEHHDAVLAIVREWDWGQPA
jgi:predicted outer membrane protein